jgi:uncharacterized cupredoxin-like copper-binding protein
MTRVLTLLLMLLALVSLRQLAIAQDASPTAITTECVAPELPPGTPTPMEEMAPPGTPAHDMAEMGSPEAIAEMAEEASPAPVEVAPGTPADAETSDRVVATAENLVGCLNAGNYLGFAALVTPNYLQSSFGTVNPYDLALFMEGFPPQELQAAEDVQTHDDGRLSVLLTLNVGGAQIDHFRAFFVDDDGQLLLDEEVSQPLAGAEMTIDVAMLDYAFEMSEDTFPGNTLVSFNLTNEGEYPHEFAVVQLPDGVTIDQVLEDPSLQEQIQFLGGAFAEPGGTGYLTLTGLEPGTYTAVCFVDVPEGVPHVVRGMVAEFTVE